MHTRQRRQASSERNESILAVIALEEGEGEGEEEGEEYEA